MQDLKTIFVHVDDTRHAAARLALARDLARRYRARLLCAYVAPPVVVPHTLSGLTDPGWKTTIETALSATQRRAHEHFLAFKDSTPGAEWLCIEGNQPGGVEHPPSLLAREARRADLAIVGKISKGEDHRDAPGMFAEELIVQSGRPVLVVPMAGASIPVGERITVAWSERREAARALRDALPLLREARMVEIVEVVPPDASDGDVATIRARLSEVQAYLARQQVRAEIDVEVSISPDPAEQMLMRATERRIDLLVAGAYGHARLREFFFGGFTRDVLNRSPIPVLVSH